MSRKTCRLVTLCRAVKKICKMLAYDVQGMWRGCTGQKTKLSFSTYQRWNSTHTNSVSTCSRPIGLQYAAKTHAVIHCIMHMPMAYTCIGPEALYSDNEMYRKAEVVQRVRTGLFCLFLYLVKSYPICQWISLFAKEFSKKSNVIHSSHLIYDAALPWKVTNMFK